MPLPFRSRADSARRLRSSNGSRPWETLLERFVCRRGEAMRATKNERETSLVYVGLCNYLYALIKRDQLWTRGRTACVCVRVCVRQIKSRKYGKSSRRSILGLIAEEKCLCYFQPTREINPHDYHVVRESMIRRSDDLFEVSE